MHNGSISVNLGDQLTFFCQVNSTAESSEDVYENLIRLEEDRCNSTGIDSIFITSCTQNGFDTAVLINSVDLINRPRYDVGRVYYFTSECVGSVHGNGH